MIQHSLFRMIVITVLALGPHSFGPPASADTVRDEQWHLDILGIAAAHKINEGENVVVGVVDTGIDSSHPDLAGSVLGGSDTTGASTDGRVDVQGHGTHIAGIVAAHGDAIGIAPKAGVLPIRIMVDAPPGASSDYARGINLAIEKGADVICVAGGNLDRPELRQAIERAAEADVVVIAGVGNESPGAAIRFPAAYNGVIAVGGTDRQNNIASFSNRGYEVVLSAPAVDILAPRLNKGYGSGTGTSAATAIVAGVAALVRSKYPDLSARDVVNRMTATATDKGPPGRDDAYGYGIVDPVAALTADIPPLPAGTGPSAEQSPPRRVWLTPALVGASVLVLATIAFLLLRRRRR